MKKDNRQGDLYYHLSQYVEMQAYMPVSLCFLDICYVPGCLLVNYCALAMRLPGSVEICCLFSPAGACIRL